MKKLSLLAVMLSFYMSMSSQNVENGVIISEGGFAMMSSSIQGKYYTYETTGLYSSDGKTLVAILYYDDPSYLSVLPQTEEIAPNALRALSGDNSFRICIPTNVKRIYPTSFITSKGEFGQMAIVIVTDDVQESTTSVKSVHEDDDSSNLEEVGRYSIQGLLVDKPVPGVNIIQMSDSSTRKVLVR